MCTRRSSTKPPCNELRRAKGERRGARELGISTQTLRNLQMELRIAKKAAIGPMSRCNSLA
jgi:hypothetical protein